MIEALETRVMLAVSLNGNGVVVEAGSGDDRIVVTARGERVIVVENGVKHRFAGSVVSGVLVRGGAGDDRVSVRGSEWKPGYARKTVNVEGGAGQDVVNIAGEMLASIHGGEGDDRLRSEGRFIFTYGDAGDDLLVALEDGGHLIGGLGADRLIGGAGKDTLITGESDRAPDDGAADFADGGAEEDDAVFDGPGDRYMNVERAVASRTPLDPDPGMVKVELGVSERRELDVTVTMWTFNVYSFEFGQVRRDGDRFTVEALAFDPAGRSFRRFTGSREVVSLGEVGPGTYTVEVVGHRGEVLSSKTLRVA